MFDAPSSNAISWSRRLLSSNVTRVTPVRELIKPMLVPGRAENCEDALDKGGATGRSGARGVSIVPQACKGIYDVLDASLRLADRRGRVAECASALTRWRWGLA